MQIHRGIKNVPCDKCGQMFCSKSFLWSHKMQSKCGAEEVVCPTCGKRWSKTYFFFPQRYLGCRCSNKYYLKRHLMQHTAERQFKCPFEGCGKSFFDQHVLKSHEKIHLDIKDYQCPMCPKQFRQSQQLKVHIKRHQGVSPINSNGCHWFKEHKITYSNNCFFRSRSTTVSNVGRHLLSLQAQGSRFAKSVEPCTSTFFGPEISTEIA